MSVKSSVTVPSGAAWGLKVGSLRWRPPGYRVDGGAGRDGIDALELELAAEGPFQHGLHLHLAQLGDGEVEVLEWQHFARPDSDPGAARPDGPG